jgi:hypothetical protein
LLSNTSWFSHKCQWSDLHFPKERARSPPLAKGDPVLSISGLDPHILAFSTPENAPTEISLGFKKKVEKKGHKNHPKKNSASTAFCAGPLAPKKKVGVEQEKVAQVILNSAA